MKSMTLILLLISTWVSAVTVDTNRSAALIDRSVTSDWEKTQQALMAVLSKKSGLSYREITSQNLVNESFSAVVLRSYYENLPAAYGQSAQWFNLVVDEEKMHRLMLDQDIPLWPQRRSEVFVWVVEEYEDETLLSSGPDSEVVYWLKKWFDVLGVPVRFYDAADQDLLAFQPQDVRFLNPDLVDYLGANTSASMSLLVFVKHTGSGYSYRFGLARPEQSTMIKNLQFIELSSGLQSLASAVQSVLAEGQRVLANEFNANTVSVVVNNLTDADQMLRLMTYFDNHPLITQYQANQLKSGQLKLMMNIKVLPDTFVKFVEDEKVLEYLPLGVGHSLIFNVMP